MIESIKEYFKSMIDDADNPLDLVDISKDICDIVENKQKEDMDCQGCIHNPNNPDGTYCYCSSCVRN